MAKEEEMKSRRKFLKTVGAGIGVAAIAAAAGGGLVYESMRPPSTPSTAGPIYVRLGGAVPLTGANAFLGSVAAVTSADIAAREINDAGGVLNGRRIQIVMEDGQCLPPVGLNAINKLITDDKVDFLIGSICSGVTLTAAPVIEQNKIPIICSGESNPDITKKAGIGGYKYIFSQCPRDDEKAQVFVSYMIQKLGLKTFSYVNLDNEYGRGQFAAAQDTTNALGGKIVSSDFFQNGEVEYRPILTKIKGLHPDALCVNLVAPEDCAKVGGQAYELQVGVPIFSFSDMVNDTAIGLMGVQAAEGIREIGPFYATYPQVAQSSFISAYRSRVGQDPEGNGALEYYCVKILADAIQKAGTTDRETVRATMETLTWSYFGIYDAHFDEYHHARYPQFIVEAKSGKVEVIDVAMPLTSTSSSTST